jgi:Domain of unknown function (DUF222)
MHVIVELGRPGISLEWLAPLIEHMYDHVRAGGPGRDDRRAGDPPADPEVLAAAFALRSRLDAALARAVARFRTERGYAPDGATSTTAWLRDRGGLTRRAAAHTVAVAARMAELPATWAAWRAGVLSTGQVEAIAANVSNDTAEQYAGQEAELVPHLARMRVADVARVMRHWKACADSDLPQADEEPQRLHLSPGLDGRWELAGELGNETGQVLATALRVAETPNGQGEEPRSAAWRRADALGDVCRFFLDTRRPVPPVGTGPISTWWSTPTTSPPGARGASRAATVPPPGATAITCAGSSTADPPGWPTSSSPVAVTMACCIPRDGRLTSTTTAPSLSRTPTAPCGPRTHLAPCWSAEPSPRRDAVRSPARPKRVGSTQARRGGAPDEAAHQSFEVPVPRLPPAWRRHLAVTDHDNRGERRWRR